MFLGTENYDGDRKADRRTDRRTNKLTNKNSLWGRKILMGTEKTDIHTDGRTDRRTNELTKSCGYLNKVRKQMFELTKTFQIPKGN